MIWIASGATLTGLMMLAWFARGRWRGATPQCRGCGYDLTQHWPAEPTCSTCGKALAPVCPECGVNLLGRRAVRFGKRARRRGLGVAGVSLTVVGLLVVSAIVWGRVTRFDWNAAKPSFWLVADARTGDADAIGELIDRFNAGQLGQAHAAFLVDRALRAQGASEPSWFDSWGAVFAASLGRGLVTEGQLKQFTRQIYDMRLGHQTTIRRGQPWDAATQIDSINLPPGRWQAIMRARRVEIGDHVFFSEPLDPGIVGRAGATSARAEYPWHPRHLPRLTPIDIEPGTYMLRATYTVGFQDPTAPPTDVVETVILESEIEVVDHDGPLVTLLRDDSLREAIERTISSRELRIFDRGRRGIQTWTGIDIREPPVDLAFDAFVRQGDREWPVGRIAAHKHTYDVHTIGEAPYTLHGFDLDADAADVILRPNTRAWEAKGLRDTDGVWDGEIVLQDVAVKIE